MKIVLILTEDFFKKIAKGSIHAVCAVENCSVILDENGHVNRKAGKCKSQTVAHGILDCITRARDEGLVK